MFGAGAPPAPPHVNGAATAEKPTAEARRKLPAFFGLGDQVGPDFRQVISPKAPTFSDLATSTEGQPTMPTRLRVTSGTPVTCPVSAAPRSRRGRLGDVPAFHPSAPMRKKVMVPFAFASSRGKCTAARVAVDFYV